MLTYLYIAHVTGGNHWMAHVSLLPRCCLCCCCCCTRDPVTSSYWPYTACTIHVCTASCESIVFIFKMQDVSGCRLRSSHHAYPNMLLKAKISSAAELTGSIATADNCWQQLSFQTTSLTVTDKKCKTGSCFLLFKALIVWLLWIWNGKSASEKVIVLQSSILRLLYLSLSLNTSIFLFY